MLRPRLIACFAALLLWALSAPSAAGQSLTLRDVDLAKLLERLRQFGLKIPVTGSGKVTARLKVDVPWRHPFTEAAYRFHGTLTSKDLTLEGVELRDARAQADYADGRLDLRRLEFVWWDPAARRVAGSFQGTATAQTSPPGDLDAHLAVEHLSIAALAARFPQLPALAGGQFDGRVRLQVPLERVRQFDGWRASGDLRVADLRFDDLPPVGAQAQFSLARQELTVGRFDVHAGSLALGGRGQLALHDHFAFDVQLAPSQADLARSAEVARHWGFDHQVSGRAEISGSARGELQPLRVGAAGTVNATDLQIDRLHVDSLRCEVASDGTRVDVRNVAAQLYRGTVTGSGAVLLGKAIGGRADLRVRGLEIGTLLRDMQVPDVNGGSISGQLALQIPAGKLKSIAAWQASGAVDVRQLSWREVPIDRLTASAELHDATASVSGLRMQLAGGQVSADARIRLDGDVPATANVTTSGIQLGRLAKLMPREAADLRGVATAQLAVRAGLARQQFDVRGTGSLDQLRFRGLQAERAQAGIGLSQYGVHLADIDVRLYGGRLNGSLIVPFQSNVAGSADIAWQQIRLGPLAAVLKPQLPPFAAVSSGRLRAALPAGHHFQLANLAGRTRVAITDIDGLGIKGGRLAATARLERGVLDVVDFSAAVAGLDAGGKLRLDLSAPYDFAGSVRAQGKLDLHGGAGLLPVVNLPIEENISGPFRLQTELTGALAPRKLQGAGRFEADRLRIGEVEIDRVAARFKADGQSIRCPELEAQLYGGHLRGSASLPLVAGKSASARLSIAGIDAGKLVHDYLRLPVALSAPITAEAAVRIPPGALARPAEWQGAAKISAPSVRINRAVVGTIAGRLRAQRDDLAYDLSGSLFGGRIACQGDWHPARAGAPAGTKGQLKVSGIELARVAAAFPHSPLWADLTGRIDFHLPFELRDKFAWPQGRGQVELTDVRWRRVTWTEHLAGVVDLNAGRLQLADFSGDLAGGRLRASASIDLDRPAASNFTLAVDDIRSQDLLAPWAPLNKLVSGPVSAHFRGSLALPWRIVGTVEMGSGQLASLPVSDVRLPVIVRFEPRTQYATVDVSDGAGQVGHGRVNVRGSAQMSHGISLDSLITFVDADLQPLLAQVGAAGQLSGSRATGTVTVAGQGVRSLADLSGNVDVKLRDIQASGSAAFQRLTPYLSGGLVGGSFNDGVLRGHFGAGTLLVQRLVVSSATTQLYATGRIALTGGLDLDVLISNYQLPGGPLASAGLARIPLAAAGPVGWIIAANELLANRSVYLDVSGTMANPVINVRPLPMVADEAARLLLGGGY